MAKSKHRRHHATLSGEILPPKPVVANRSRPQPKTIDAVVMARVDLPRPDLRPMVKRPRLAHLAVIGADARKYHPAGRNRPVLNIHGQPSYSVQPAAPRKARPPVVGAVLRNGVWRMPDGKPMPSRSRVASSHDTIPVGLSFRQARILALCLKRKARREVLMARGGR